MMLHSDRRDSFHERPTPTIYVTLGSEVIGAKLDRIRDAIATLTSMIGVGIVALFIAAMMLVAALARAGAKP